MALEATHMRFALDLKDRYQVKDLEKYIVGSIYPDSRYISGIDRELTHSDKFLNSEFLKDDFHKGWHCHFLADKFGRKVTENIFKELIDLKESDFNDWWEFFSAIKVVQDINDINKIDSVQCIKYLENYAFNPNSEKLINIKIYNKTIVDLYNKEKEKYFENYFKMWLDWGVDSSRISKLMKNVKIFIEDKNTLEKISKVYDETLKEINLYLKT